MTTPGGADEELEATGATDWLPSITDVIRDQGAQSLELAVWGGEACDGSPLPTRACVRSRACHPCSPGAGAKHAS
ncbi:MAG: hypothetical protein ACPIOQ_41020 [Promethearchaeia archaeon]